MAEFQQARRREAVPAQVHVHLGGGRVTDPAAVDHQDAAALPPEHQGGAQPRRSAAHHDHVVHVAPPLSEMVRNLDR
ncbi:hypothetical protein LUX39_51580 [Actinomadura madurae]|nr:hypothetical protein [Actinomadura madurae]MCP9955635.1 hypothetical protein [Actinomadura madurae]MCP9972371.1 hypothetical protein [Actinomadura madurae]MCQ0003569.1 hypothetical protein [Actinomadura madurae]MCQ0021069.1 hypothetical protein [Actinomadura madurae]